MNKYLGFNPHRYGDLFINLTACEIVKDVDTKAHVTFVINGDYRSAAPLFLDQPNIDRIHITNSAVGGFNEQDVRWINAQGFCYVFNPLQDHCHSMPWWKTGRNQPLECAFMHGLPLRTKYTGKLSLNRWFEPSPGFDKYVALQAFAGSYDVANKKQLTVEKAQEIVDLIRSKGYQVLQLGLPHEPLLQNVVRFDTDFFNAVKNMLGCKALVTTDSSFSWAASCYDYPTLGIYSYEYYGKEYISAIQPINPNATYLSAANVNEVSITDIENKLSSFL